MTNPSGTQIGIYTDLYSVIDSVSPAVGNLVGSEGGEFVFELQPQPLSSTSQQFDPRAMQLTAQLETLQKEIAAKQAKLLQLQQSIQSETAKLGQIDTTRSTPPVKKPPDSRAFELDRQGQQFYRQKKYDLALKVFQEAVQLKPNDPVLLNNLGLSTTRWIAITTRWFGLRKRWRPIRSARKRTAT